MLYVPPKNWNSSTVINKEQLAFGFRRAVALAKKYPHEHKVAFVVPYCNHVEHLAILEDTGAFRYSTGRPTTFCHLLLCYEDSNMAMASFESSFENSAAIVDCYGLRLLNVKLDRIIWIDIVPPNNRNRELFASYVTDPDKVSFLYAAEKC